MSALARLADLLDALSRAIGSTVKWLALAVVLIQAVVVVLRYVYGTSFIWAQESVTYAHAILFMTAIGYTMLVDGHVRVDVLYSGWSARAKATTDLLGILIAVLPFCALLVWASWGWAAQSWRIGEGPMQVGGLPLQPLLKSLVPAMAILLAAQALAVAIRCLLVIAGQAPTHLPGKPGAAAHG
jgi:TRAP-type mannitol/chloroaromatic compound transport system permease small subunit